jgi:signal transduction histidine kinase
MTSSTMTTAPGATTNPGATTMLEMTSTEPSPNRRRHLPLERIRIVGWFVVLLAGAAAVTSFAVRQILLNRLDERVDDALRQEVEEMRQLVGGINPETGEPFGTDVEAIFDNFLSRNVLQEGEALFAIVDGQPYLASFGAPYRLDSDAELVGRWAALSETAQGRSDTPAGEARWLAMPLRSRGETLGVFVAANFVERERDEVNDAIRVTMLVSGVVVAVGSVLAWAVAGRVLAPVRQLTETTQSITAARQLDRRIEVAGSGELSRLAETINEMLERLQQAFKSQATFINDASHELRTPLTIVRGHLQLLDDDPGEAAKTMVLVMDELNRMGRIVDELLLLARADQPGFLRPDRVELGSLVDEVLAKAQALGSRSWVVDGTAEAYVDGDRDRLTQAMVNLLSNAVDHTDDGAEIGIGTAVRDGEAYLWVRDTGQGVPADEQRRIFDRFARGANNRRGSRGAGLGLAITRAIVDAHGGRIKVDSRAGEGATFTMILPLAPGLGGAQNGRVWAPPRRKGSSR